MSERHIVEQRCFVGQLADQSGEYDVEMVFDEYQDERFNEQFVVSDQFVSYADLTHQFGKRIVDKFIERAIQNAR